MHLDDFESGRIATVDVTIFCRWGGAGRPLLLLHGFPQTHVMWSKVASILADEFTVVCADLRGYGQSDCPTSTLDHGPYSKRSMARDMVAVMSTLGFPRFAVAGHDRGGRVAYRLALDHPEVVTGLAVLDIVPTLEVWERADQRLALAFWPWVLLAQPEPLPERFLTAAPDAVVDDALGGWGSPVAAFDAISRAAYVDSLRDPAHVHAICEEYRAAATIDCEHDDADRRDGRRITCPLLALWSSHGLLGSLYESSGGPLALWRAWADDVHCRAVAGGHFFPEEHPADTAQELRRFFGRGGQAIKDLGMSQ